jgi:hypothetical protein
LKAAKKQAEGKPNDESIAAEAARQEKASVEARQLADDASLNYQSAQADADETRAKYDTARKLHERAREAKKNLELAQKILEGAKLRVADAERRLQN